MNYYTYPNPKVRKALEALIKHLEHFEFESFIKSVKKGYATRDHNWHRVRLVRDWLKIEPAHDDENEQIEAAINYWVNREVRLVKAPRKPKAVKIETPIGLVNINDKEDLETAEAAVEANEMADQAEFLKSIGMVELEDGWQSLPKDEAA
jgi:hypothetical protein